MELSMNTTINHRLATFNTLALHFQDEAYTLAYYLLGDETRSAEVTQLAFDRLYQRSGLRLEQFRLEVLHEIWAQTRQLGRAALSHALARDALCQQLMGLKDDERLAVILVDVLALDYEEAGRVMGGSRKQVGKLLAQGRMKMAEAKATAL